MGGGVNVAGFIRQTKGFSSENKRSADIISEVWDKVSVDQRKISEFETANRNSAEWAGLSTLKGVNQDLRDECQSCAEKIRRNAEKQKEEYRYIWETIVATKRGVPDFLDKHDLGQYTSSLTEFGYEEVEDLLYAEIKTGGDLADDRCWVVLDDKRLQIARGHLRTIRQEINNLHERIANIPHRMKNIISSANEAAIISDRFLDACRDSINRARRLKIETRGAAKVARQNRTQSGYHEAMTIIQGGLFAVIIGSLVVTTGGLAIVTGGTVAAAAGTGAIGAGGAAAVAGAGAVGAGLLTGLMTAANHLVSSSEIFSDTFQEKVIDNLNDHQRKMGEKARELERQWLNDIHACVIEMESTCDSVAVKHKLVVIPSSVNSIKSDFDTIFYNINFLQSSAKKYESGSASQRSSSSSGIESNTYCSVCGTSPCLNQRTGQSNFDPFT